MTTERFVVIGVATARSDWFRATGQWASSAALPIEFIRCISVEECRARLQSARPHSALVIDEAIHGLDRDLIASAKDSGCAVIVVTASTSPDRWRDLGADNAIAESDFDRTVFLDALRQVAQPVTNVTPKRAEQLRPKDSESSAAWSGEFVAVVGAGGTGTSTAAMSLAQGLGSDPRQDGLVCLADLQLDADLAMLHDAQDVVPGLQEMLDLHRKAVPSRAKIQAGCFAVEDRHYDLLLGLRQHRDWTLLRRRTTEATLASLTRAYRYVVADVSCDLEGVDETGSHDIEDRNLLSRSAIAQASCVVVVGDSTMHGTFAMHRVIRRLLAFGVPADRVLPVLNNAPRRVAKRTELIAGFIALVNPEPNGADETIPLVPSPLLLRRHRALEELARAAAPMPSSLVKPLTTAVIARLGAAAPNVRPTSEPEPVKVGSLGSLAP